MPRRSFQHAGSGLAKPHGARDYRGTINGLENVEIGVRVRCPFDEVARQLPQAGDSVPSSALPMIVEKLICTVSRKPDHNASR